MSWTQPSTTGLNQPINDAHTAWWKLFSPIGTGCCFMAINACLTAALLECDLMYVVDKHFKVPKDNTWIFMNTTQTAMLTGHTPKNTLCIKSSSHKQYHVTFILPHELSKQMCSTPMMVKKKIYLSIYLSIYLMQGSNPVHAVAETSQTETTTITRHSTQWETGVGIVGDGCDRMWQEGGGENARFIHSRRQGGFTVHVL